MGSTIKNPSLEETEVKLINPLLEIEVKPNAPYFYQRNTEGRRLHICQAMTGSPPADGDKGTKRKATSSALECKLEWVVKSEGSEEAFECTMLPESSYIAELDFKETENVTFSVVGPHSVKLLGYVIPIGYFIPKVREIVDEENPNKTTIRSEVKIKKEKKIFKKIGVSGLKPNVLEHSPVAKTKKLTTSTSQKNKEATKLEKWDHNSGSGLSITEIAKMDLHGKKAILGKMASIKYTAWIAVEKKGRYVKHGNCFDTNVEEDREPFTFPLGNEKLAIAGLSIGILDEGMRVGDKRRILIPPHMGYAGRQVGKVPPNTWLLYEVELMDVN